MLIFGHKGPEWPWGLFWVLKKALKWVNPLKKVLKRVNPLFWVLKKVLKKVTVLKWALKKVLFWVVSSKKCSKKCLLLKRLRLLKKGLNRVGPSKKMLKRVGVDLPVIGGLSHVYRRIQLVFKGCAGACQDHLVSLDNEFTDVTLALEDGQLVEAHKVILAGCSTPNLIIWVSNIKLFTLHARITYQASLTKARQL